MNPRERKAQTLSFKTLKERNQYVLQHLTTHALSNTPALFVQHPVPNHLMLRRLFDNAYPSSAASLFSKVFTRLTDVGLHKDGFKIIPLFSQKLDGRALYTHVERFLDRIEPTAPEQKGLYFFSRAEDYGGDLSDVGTSLIYIGKTKHRDSRFASANQAQTLKGHDVFDKLAPQAVNMFGWLPFTTEELCPFINNLAPETVVEIRAGKRTLNEELTKLRKTYQKIKGLTDHGMNALLESGAQKTLLNIERFFINGFNPVANFVDLSQLEIMNLGPLEDYQKYSRKFSDRISNSLSIKEKNRMLTQLNPGSRQSKLRGFG